MTKLGTLALFIFLTQRFDGSLRGAVTDATRAVLPGAMVTAANNATGTTQQTTTNSFGIYQFPNLLVGKYTVTIELPGFKKATLTDVDIVSNQTVDANATLEAGAITAEVSVTASGEMVSLTTSQVGGSAPERAVIDIPNPVLGGSPLNLAVLFPNTTTQGGGVLGEGGSIGGNRPRNNNFTIDGVDNNDVAVTGPQAPVIQDAVAEFNLLTNQFSAEYGHSTAGQFNIITKSGTNTLHGSAFFYGQNRRMNALDNLQKAAIANGDIPGKPGYDFARTGVTVGGPILRDKLFYFGAYEYQTQGLSSTGVTVLAPTQAGLSTLNSLAANSAVREILAQMPAALAASRTVTVNNRAIPIGNLRAFAADFFNQHDFQTNIDASLTNHQLRGRFLFDRFRKPNPNLDLPLPQFTGKLEVDNRKLIVTDVWAVNSGTVLDLRTSYSRNVQRFTVPEQFSNFPNVAIDDLGLSFGPEGSSPQTGVQNTYQGVVNVSHVLGSHQFKEGFEYRNWISPQQFLPRGRGEWDYANLTELINDLVPGGLNGALRGAGLSVFAGNQQAIYWFVQDDWKATQNLTLNLGLRYEWTSQPRDAKLQALNQIASLPGVFDFREPKSDKNNFGPRIGFAYSPNSRTSIRGGFAVAYDVTFQNLPLLQLPPQLQTEQNPELTCAGANRPAWCATGRGFLAGGGLLQDNVPPRTQAEARSATQGLIIDQVQPKTLTWTLGLQREMFSNWQVEVRYLGTRGLNLPVQTRRNAISIFEKNPNLVLPTYFSRNEVPSSVPLTATTRADAAALQDLRYAAQGFDGGFVSAFDPVGSSIYHAGSVEVNRNVAPGLWLKTGYTFSKAIDTATNELFSSRVNPRRPQNPYDIRDERGLSTLDKPHKFTVAWVYDLPQLSSDNGFLKAIANGWQINGAYIAESGQPVTVQSGVDANGDFDSAADRAILNPNGTGLTGSGVDFVVRNALGVTSISSSNPGDHLVVGYVARNPSARFVVAELGARSTVGRNTVRSPGINNWDLSFFKNNKITERTSVQFRFEVYNAFNHRQPTLGSRTFQQFNENALSTSYANASALNFLNDAQFNGGSRQVQLSLKVIF
ncbi:MAG: TonB-dependent receptor [Acidobacteria bacterium]|nr:TonB-dependent receptor [Acidobacteriota bacterium]